jgi:hypothetical protein
MARRIACSLMCLVLIAGAAPVGGARAAGRYVAIGDSIAGAANSYVDRDAARLGISDLHKLASGATAAGWVASELPAALALIDDPTDTAVVTVQIGGHDYLSGNCVSDWNQPTCDFADSYAELLARLGAALDADAGAERFLAVAYYNPAAGLGDQREREMAVGLRGSDARLDTGAHGDAWGMSDVVAWVACRRGATFVDPWNAFEAGGQALMADSLHPTAEGQAIIADLLADPAAGGPAPSCPVTAPFATTGADEGDRQAHGVVEPRLAPARWWFEYGPTTALGTATDAQELPASAGARAVAAPLPEGPPGTVHHVRLVVESDHGRFTGEDRTVTMAAKPDLTARLRGSRALRRVLARGVKLRVGTTGASLRLRGRLRRHGHDPLVLRERIAWSPGATRTISVPLTRHGRRLVRRATHPRIAVTVTAAGPGGVSAPVRLMLRITRAG